MGIIHGDLTHRPEERHRRLAGRIHVTRQDVHQSRAAHRSGMEGIEHGIAVGQVAFDGQRTARHHRSHYRFAGALQGGEQFALGTDQVQVGQTVGFARKDGLFTEECQHHVGAACGSDHIVKTGALLTAVRQAGHIDDLTRETLLQGLERRYGMRLLTVEAPGSQLVVRCIRHGSGNQDGPDTAAAEREQSVVLQQDDRLFHGLAGCFQMRRRILD